MLVHVTRVYVVLKHETLMSSIQGISICCYELISCNNIYISLLITLIKQRLNPQEGNEIRLFLEEGIPIYGRRPTRECEGYKR